LTMNKVSIQMNKEDFIKNLSISPIIQLDGYTIDITNTLFTLHELMEKDKSKKNIVIVNNNDTKENK